MARWMFKAIGAITTLLFALLLSSVLFAINKNHHDPMVRHEIPVKHKKEKKNAYHDEYKNKAGCMSCHQG